MELEEFGGGREEREREKKHVVIKRENIILMI
jgi:hypothetical protein